jgi:uncharacterized protein YkwD
MTTRPAARTFAAVSRRAALLLALAFALSSAGVLATPAAANAWADNTWSSESENQLLTLTNQSRAAAGLPALKMDTQLRDLARWRSKDMDDRQYFSHSIPPDGKKVFDYMTAQGYCYKLAGENIGWNRGWGSDAEATTAVHNSFMNSSGHRANILGTSWNHVGIGAWQAADGKKYWTVIFVDKCGAAPAPTATPKPTAAPTATPKPTAAPTATPKATPKPTAAPTATPKATPKPTPKPTATATAKATTRPATPSPVATPAPTLEPTPEITLAPTPAPTAEPTPVPTTGPTADPTLDPTASPTDAPSSIGGTSGWRVLEPAPDGGLVNSIVVSVTARYFGG